MQTTLPQKYYIDPDVFADELERFYCRGWVCAGRAPEIARPGDYFLREIGRESIIVVRGEDGAIRSFYNVCRHRGTRICPNAEGRFLGSIQCGYHGWTYGLDGRLTGAPHMTDPSFRREDFPLHGIPADTWHGHIFINLNPQGNGDGDQLGDLWNEDEAWHTENRRVAARKTYTVN